MDPDQPHLAAASVCSRASNMGPLPVSTASTAGGLLRLSGAARQHIPQSAPFERSNASPARYTQHASVEDQ